MLASLCRFPSALVPWLHAGFYLKADLFPLGPGPAPDLLLLGPFNGRPACQQIQTRAGKGVCADTFAKETTLIVPDVDAYPGHIGACLPCPPPVPVELAFIRVSC